MTNSSKVRKVREHYENADPESAADRAVSKFEREAISAPAALAAPDGELPSWQMKLHFDAAELYRDLVIAGDRGIALSELGKGMGRERRANALRLLRRSGASSEVREAWGDLDGQRLVLRAVVS